MEAAAVLSDVLHSGSGRADGSSFSMAGEASANGNQATRGQSHPHCAEIIRNRRIWWLLTMDSTGDRRGVAAR